MSLVDNRRAWMDQGLCIQIGDAPFFPGSIGAARTAMRICRGPLDGGSGPECPVRAECLAYALELNDADHLDGELYGVWGGEFFQPAAVTAKLESATRNRRRTLDFNKQFFVPLEQRVYNADVMARPCPKEGCGAQPLQRCMMPNGGQSMRPHMRRCTPPGADGYMGVIGQGNPEESQPPCQSHHPRSGGPSTPG